MFTIIPVQAVLRMKPCSDDSNIAAGLQREQQRFLAIRQKYVALGHVFQARMAAAGGGISGVQLLAKACVGCKPFPREECRHEHYEPNVPKLNVDEARSEL